MPTTPPSGKSDLAKIVEKQMRNWELARAQRIPPRPDAEPAEVAEFVTISRAVGSGGSQVATLLGKQLGWPVFDREILQTMAGDDQVRSRLYEHLDERDTTWLEEAMRWLMRGEFQRDDYFYRLSETVLALARKERAVFLGRGVDLILPRDRGLRVRITALRDKRAKVLAERENISEALAQAEIERIDQERADFRRHHFGKSTNDPAYYDLTISLNRFSAEQTVELIRVALRARGVVP